MMEWERETSRRQTTTRSEVRTETRQIRTVNNKVIDGNKFMSNNFEVSDKSLQRYINGVESKPTWNGIDGEVSMYSSRNRHLTEAANSDAGSESSAIDQGLPRHRRSSGGSQGRRLSSGSTASQGSTTKVSSITMPICRSPFPVEHQNSIDKNRSGNCVNENSFGNSQILFPSQPKLS